jgi:hypothetical protein
MIRSERVFLGAAAGAFTLWMALVALSGGLHFDDFISIGESRGALSLEGWTATAADGRWQPLKRATFDLIARAAGLTFWPYALALAAAHLLTAAAAAFAARAIWPGGTAGTLAGLAVLASLNLSAYSLATVGTLHGILSVAFGLWSVAFALRAALAPAGEARFLAFSSIMALAACLYKETGVTTPVLALYGMWLAARERSVSPTTLAKAVAGPAAGLALYFLLRLVIDVPLVPERSRYSLGGIRPLFLNAAVVVMNVLPWAAAAALARIANRRRGVLPELLMMMAAALALTFPSLLLSWSSPNFWYAAVPAVALGGVGLLRRSDRLPTGLSALAALTLVVFIGVTAAGWISGAHRWGPYAESSLRHWTTFPREGGRIIWFDADSRARYGGLARTIGPGARLTYALRLTSGDPSIKALACISILVGPPCIARPGDELYVHEGGRLERVDVPPPGAWYVMP